MGRMLGKNSGMSLVEVMVSVSILGIVSMGFSSYFSVLKSQHKKLESQVISTLAIAKVKELIKNEAKWAETLNSSTNYNQLKCLKIKTDYLSVCTEGVLKTGSDFDGLNFYEKNASGNTVLVYSSKATTSLWGINWEGDFCQGYDAVNGNDDCPFRITTELSLQCSNVVPDCKIRNLHIVGRLLYRPSSGRMQMNFDALTFFENRLQHSVVDATNCTDFGGVFNVTQNTCVLPTISSACAGANQVLTGFTGGVAQCTNI